MTNVIDLNAYRRQKQSVGRIDRRCLMEQMVRQRLGVSLDEALSAMSVGVSYDSVTMKQLELFKTILEEDV